MPIQKPVLRASAAPAASSIPVVALREAPNPLIAFRLLFHSGSSDDPAGQEGITALAAKLMAEGGTESLDASTLIDTLYPMAAELEVQVDKEQTVFTGLVHKDHLAAFWPILTDVVVRPRWDEKEFARLRDLHVSAIKNDLRSNSDEELGKATLESMLYDGHPYGHPVSGTVQGVSQLSLAEVKAHAARVFTQSRLTIGVAGGFETTLPVELASKLGALPVGDARPALAAARTVATRVTLVEKEAPATALSMGFAYDVKRGDPDFPALWLAVSALGEHRQFGGRLMEELRAKRGLNYGNYAYAEAFHNGWIFHPRVNISRSQQFFSIWIRPVEHPNRVFALRAALYELDKMLKEGLSEEELARTRAFMDGYTRLWTLTLTQRLGYALDDAFYGEKDHLATARARWKELDAAEVNRVLRRWLDPAKLRFAFVTNDAAGLKKTLASGEPTPIKYPTPKDKAVLEEDKKIAVYPLRFEENDIAIVPAGDLFEK